MIIDGKVLDVTAFMPDHPGGEKAILLYAGRDATEEFNMLHDPKVCLSPPLRRRTTLTNTMLGAGHSTVRAGGGHRLAEEVKAGLGAGWTSLRCVLGRLGSTVRFDLIPHLPCYRTLWL